MVMPRSLLEWGRSIASMDEHGRALRDYFLKGPFEPLYTPAQARRARSRRLWMELDFWMRCREAIDDMKEA